MFESETLARPIRSQSAWRWDYYPAERPTAHLRRPGPNAFVAARLGSAHRVLYFYG